MKRKQYVTSVPPTPAELGAAAAGWKRKGLIRRLVRDG